MIKHTYDSIVQKLEEAASRGVPLMMFMQTDVEPYADKLKEAGYAASSFTLPGIALLHTSPQEGK